MGSKRKINNTNRQMEYYSLARDKEIEFKKSGRYKPQHSPSRRKRRKKTNSSPKKERSVWILNYLPKRN